MKNFKQIIVLFLISILLIGTLISCDMANTPKSLSDVKKIADDLSSRISNDANYKALVTRFKARFQKMVDKLPYEQMMKSGKPYIVNDENFTIKFDFMGENNMKVEINVISLLIDGEFLNMEIQHKLSDEGKDIDVSLNYAGNHIFYKRKNKDKYSLTINGFLLTNESEIKANLSEIMSILTNFMI